MSFARKVRQIVDGIVDNEQHLWHRFNTNSGNYMQALQLNASDVEALERNQGQCSMYPEVAEIAEKAFLNLSIEEENFALTVKHVCGVQYGGHWVNALVAVCTSNTALNKAVGFGTTLLNIVSDEWHCKLVAHLTESVSDENTEKITPPEWLDDEFKKHW